MKPISLQISRMYLRQGHKIPKGWGIAYWHYHQDIAVILPIPINIITGQVRKAYHALISNKWHLSKIDKMCEEAFKHGKEEGRIIGEAQERHRVEEFIKASVKEMFRK